MDLPRISPVRALRAAGFAMTLVTVAGCADGTGVTRRTPVSLSFAAGTQDAGVRGTPYTLSGGGHVLDISDADLTLADARLEGGDGRDDADSDSDSDGRHRGEAVFRTGPVTIALPLDGGVITPFSGDVPFGTYDELEAEFEFLRLRGTYDGQPFDVTLAIDRKVSLDLRPPLVVDADHTARNVTLNADVAHCFRDATGAPIDPRRLQAEEPLRASVRNCIVRALRALEDHDRDADDADSDSDRDSDRT